MYFPQAVTEARRGDPLQATVCILAGAVSHVPVHGGGLENTLHQTEEWMFLPSGGQPQEEEEEEEEEMRGDEPVPCVLGPASIADSQGLLGSPTVPPRLLRPAPVVPPRHLVCVLGRDRWHDTQRCTTAAAVRQWLWLWCGCQLCGQWRAGQGRGVVATHTSVPTHYWAPDVPGNPVKIFLHLG